MKRTLIAVAFLAFSPHGSAEKFSLGSMDLQSCPTKESATVRWGKQRATLVLDIEAPDFRRVQSELRDCAERGVKTATLPALLKKLPGAAPVFWEEFLLCTRYTEWASADLSIETTCQ